MTMGEYDTTNPVHEAAERLVKLGISVCPIAPGTKEPPEGFKWGAFATRIADVNERYEAFSVNDFHLAVVTGPVSGNLVVLDYDGQGGYDTHARASPQLSLYPRVTTGSGKSHVWVRTPQPVRKYVTQAPDGSRLEVRSGTHITLCPPSLHPSGGSYTWAVPPWDGIPTIELGSIGLVDRRPPGVVIGKPLTAGDPLTDDERNHLIDLIQPHYVATAKHALVLALSGWMANHGVPVDDTLDVVARLADPGDKTRDMSRWVQGTYQKAAEGIAVAGWSALTDPAMPLVSEDAAARLDRVLRWRNPVHATGP